MKHMFLLQRSYLFGCLILGFMLCAGILYGQPAEIKNAFHFIEIEQPARGMQALDRLAGIGEKNPDYLYYLGLGYIHLGKLDKAMKAFDEGIALKEKYGLNYAGKAHAMILQGRSREAASLLQTALDRGRNKDARILTAVAAAYLADSANVKGAIELLTNAKAIEGDNRETHLLLGDAYSILNKGGESVSSYEGAAKADPSWAKPHFKIALVFERAKNRDMVLESLKKAIATDGLFAPAYRKLGEMHYLLKEADKAVSAYEKYLAITENPGDARFQYAFFLIMAKQFDKANRIFEEVIHLENVPAIALKYYAFSLLEQDTTRKNAERARPLLEKYMSMMKPKDIQATDHAYYGKLLLKLKEDSLASESFARSLALDSAQHDILKIHGSNLLRNKRFAEAAGAYEQLVALKGSPALQDLWSLGQAYYFDEQYVNADAVFNKIMARQEIGKLPHQMLLFAARSKANIDSTMTAGLAKPMYEAFLERVSNNVSRYETEVIEAYSYLGAYYIHEEENVAKAKGYYEKILELDASNPTAKEFMKTIKGG